MNIKHLRHALRAWSTRLRTTETTDDSAVSLRTNIAAELDELADELEHEPTPFTINDAEMCALLRQTFTSPISYEGQSGPRLHALLGRIQRHLGPQKYAEFVTGDWPKHLI